MTGRVDIQYTQAQIVKSKKKIKHRFWLNLNCSKIVLFGVQ